MRRSSFLVGAGILAGAAFGVVSPATALDDLVIPIDSVVRGEPFSTVAVASEDVDADLVGKTCEATLTADNNESVHPGNNLIVVTGSSAVTFPNVESESFQQTTAQSEIVMGETVEVDLQFGASGVSSGGLTLSFDCTQPEVTTTTTTEVPIEVLPETQTPEPNVPAAPLPDTPVESATAAQPTFTG